MFFRRSARRRIVNPYDRRYPRPLLLKVVRYPLRIAWAVVTFVILVPVSNVVSLIWNWSGDFDGTFLQEVVQQFILPFERLMGNPRLAVVVLPAVSVVFPLGFWADWDSKYEGKVMKRRKGMKRARNAQKRASREAVATVSLTEAPVSPPPHLPDVGGGSEQLPNPPLDLAFLPVSEHFVGRAADLEWLLQRLRQGTESGVTALAGMVGIGKSTLAAKAVRILHEEGRFKDGIAVVPCQDVHDARELLNKVLARFDTSVWVEKSQDTSTWSKVVSKLLKGKDALIVLDNIESEQHIERVVQSVREAGATCLLTADQQLADEVVPSGATLRLGQLSPDELLSLFAQAYGRAGSDVLSASERSAAQRIVKTLGGHTFAVRIAAAYAHSARRNLAELARELERDPLKVRGSDGRRIVAAIFKKSTERLADDALQLFTALAAFGTPEFGRQAALTLARGLSLGEPEPNLDLLVRSELVDTPLEERPEGGDWERLRLHPLLQSFARNELSQWPEELRSDAFTSIASYFAAYIPTAPEEAIGADEQNIADALEWARKHARGDLVEAICLGMAKHWLSSGRIAAAAKYLPWGIEVAEASARKDENMDARRQAAYLELMYGRALHAGGDARRAKATFERNLHARQELGDRPGEAAALYELGLVSATLGELPQAESYLTSALAIHREVGDHYQEARDLTLLGEIAFQQGYLAKAEEHLKLALGLNSGIAVRREEEQREEGIILSELGRIARKLDNLPQAEAFLVQALSIHRTLRDRHEEGIDLINLGQIVKDRGRREEARQDFESAKEIHQEMEDRRDEGVALLELGKISQEDGHFDEAESRFQAALSIHKDIPEPREEAADLAMLGKLALARGDQAKAEQYFAQAVAIDTQIGDRQSKVEDLLALAQVVQMLGRMEEAERYCQQATEISEELKHQEEPPATEG